MSLALHEARNARALGEVPVGAVLTSPAGEILAACGNRVIGLQDPTAHAEILALREGSAKIGNERLSGCVLTVTLEPCLMCAGAIILSRISGLVFGAADRLEGAIISRADYASLTGTRRGMWHMGGVMAADCATILKEFFQARRQ